MKGGVYRMLTNQKWQECEVPGERQFHDAFTEKWEG